MKMNCFMRPYIRLGIIALAGATVIVVPPDASGQLSGLTKLVDEPSALLLHSGSQGYMGVLVGDVDNDSAPKLKLKEVRGAVITLIDHDAPAAQAGLRVNDVVLEVNGQVIEGAEQFGRILREIPAGRKVTLVFSRDGATQTVAVQLADRKKMENDVWNKLGSGNDPSSPVTGMGILGTGGAGDAPLPGGFHMPFFGSTLNVGALVEPLTSQMAEYLGVPSGLMVKQVARKSEAAVAGFKAFDVILKVGADSISTMSDWDRSLRANQGKAVTVTVLRDKKQQTLSLQVDSKRKGEVDFEEIFPDQNCVMMAMMDPEVEQFQVTPEQTDQFQKQMEQFREEFDGQNFKIDEKQLEELKKQMEEWKKNFKPEDFKIDPKQMDEFRREMNKLQRQMEEFRAHGFGSYV
jgi:membrane-associated protease RseP (regulator of RpoE activity)